VNDFDRAARYAVKHGPQETRQWLFPRLDSQSAPRPGEPDRRCDTIMELVDEQKLTPPWACVIERFTEADAIDRTLEYVARLADCEPAWREALEGIMIKVSPFAEEIRQEARIEMARKHTREALEMRFPNQVPAALIERVNAETNLDKLERWHKLAITATLEAFQQGMG
jgi:hypothetical protein